MEEKAEKASLSASNKDLQQKYKASEADFDHLLQSSDKKYLALQKALDKSEHRNRELEEENTRLKSALKRGSSQVPIVPSKVCTICDKVFASNGSLRVHKSTVHTDPGKPCKFCKKVVSKKYMKRHLSKTCKKCF
jgi:hypothetical protein